MSAKIIFSEEEKDHICDLYDKYRSTRRVAAEIDRSRSVVQKILYERKVELAGPAEHHKKPVDSEFFAQITPASAYFLGLFVADGSIARSSAGSSVYFNLALKKEDAYILEVLRDEIAPEHRLIDDRHMTKFTVGDSPLCLNVVQWGIKWRNKSLMLDECHSLFAQLRRAGHLSHFTRGAIDGDGSIFLGNGYNAGISLVGTHAFINKIWGEINRELEMDHGSLIQDKRSKNLWEVRYTGRGLVQRVGEWMYADKGKYYLRRKYERFLGVVKSRGLLETPKSP